MRTLGMFLDGTAPEIRDLDGREVQDLDFLLLLNAHHEAVEFRLPLPLPRGSWSTTVDTAQPETKESSRDVGEVLTIEGRSFALLHRKHAAAPPAPSS
jgi:glycogen operon protein